LSAKAVCDVLTGAAIALISFGLAALWDNYKHRRAERRREQAALVGFNEEMLANYPAAENTLNLLGHERQARLRGPQHARNQGPYRSRENFRIQHLGGNDALFERGLEGYTAVLMEVLRDLKVRIDEATHELEPYLTGNAAE
jgi:hypothetical protein